MLKKTPATIQCARVSGLILIALGALFANAASAASVNALNGTQFTTTTGTPIQAHGGGVIKVGPYYYWFGENRNPNSTFYAVSCYRSTDLKNMDVVSGSLAYGAEIIQYMDTGGANQRWLPIDIGGGRYAIKSKLSGKLLDVDGASLNTGANLIQMMESGGNSQKWALEPTN